jgi:hypothetical protein
MKTVEFLYTPHDDARTLAQMASGHVSGSAVVAVTGEMPGVSVLLDGRRVAALAWSVRDRSQDFLANAAEELARALEVATHDGHIKLQGSRSVYERYGDRWKRGPR